MTNPDIHIERLAALLDGRLGEPEREETLRRLELAGDDVRAAWADAAAIVRELEAESSPVTPDAAEPSATVLPFPRPAPPRRVWERRALLVAASLAAVALVPLALLRTRGDGLEPTVLVSRFGDAPAGIPAEPWAVTRGAGEPISPSGRAVRLGARLLDLELAIARGDTGARAIGRSVAALLVNGAPLTGAPVNVYRQVAAGDATVDADARRAAWKEVASLAGEDEVRLGAWLEAARVAAATRDAAFFTGPDARAMLGRAELAAVRDAVRTPDWPSVTRELAEALRLAGR